MRHVREPLRMLTRALLVTAVVEWPVPASGGPALAGQARASVHPDVLRRQDKTDVQTERVSTVRTLPPSVTIPRVSTVPGLEPFLGDSPDKPGVHITGFRQREPGDGDPVTQETSAYLFYDDANLYVVFVCHDTPAKIRGRLAPREDIEEDDQVSMYLDTFHDGRHAYVFSSNPRGVQEDAILTEGTETEGGDGATDKSFDTLWRSEGRITSDGYIVEMAIPFKSLRFAEGPGHTWGIALARTISRYNETAFWPYITERLPGFVRQLATLEGLQGISAGHNVQLIPYITTAASRILDDSPALRTTTTNRGGFDAKVVLPKMLTLDIAVNPDFSEVESNDPQVLTNQRFEVFFPEKRPLFTENAGYFRTPLNLFYSRRIADPSVGARLTGKAGSWVIGAVAANDRAPESPSDTSLPSMARADIGAFRLQREVGAQSNVGLFVTSSDIGDASNRVVSFDGRVSLTPTWVATGQVAHSVDRAFTGERSSGNAVLGTLEHGGRHFSYSASYTDLDPLFRAPLGFIQRVDIRDVEQSAAYLWRPNRGGLVSLGPSASASLVADHRGRTQDWVVSPTFAATFAGAAQLRAAWIRARERFEGIDFEKHATSGSVSTAWLRWMTLYAFVSDGVGVNYYPAPGLAPFLAHTRDMTFTATFRPTTRIRFDETYIFSGLATRPRRGSVERTATHTMLETRLVRSRANVQFTSRWSLRAIVDYNVVASDTSLVRQDGSKDLTLDLLVRWLLHPGTAVYVGYTDRYENEKLLDTFPPILQRTSSPTFPSARQLFVKVSYQWRF